MPVKDNMLFPKQSRLLAGIASAISFQFLSWNSFAMTMSVFSLIHINNPIFPLLSDFSAFS
jgi:hypothetical protein